MNKGVREGRRNLHYVDPRLVLMERVQHDLRRDRRAAG